MNFLLLGIVIIVSTSVCIGEDPIPAPVDPNTLLYKQIQDKPECIKGDGYDITDPGICAKALPVVTCDISKNLFCAFVPGGANVDNSKSECKPWLSTCPTQLTTTTATPTTATSPSTTASATVQTTTAATTIAAATTTTATTNANPTQSGGSEPTPQMSESAKKWIGKGDSTAVNSKVPVPQKAMKDYLDPVKCCEMAKKNLCDDNKYYMRIACANTCGSVGTDIYTAGTDAKSKLRADCK